MYILYYAEFHCIAKYNFMPWHSIHRSEIFENLGMKATYSLILNAIILGGRLCEVYIAYTNPLRPNPPFNFLYTNQWGGGGGGGHGPLCAIAMPVTVVHAAMIFNGGQHAKRGSEAIERGHVSM